LISGSKAFSYAGQRIAVMIISPELYNFESELLEKYFAQKNFGRAMVFGALYALTSGTAHSPQYALTALFKAANDGKFNFIEGLKDYEKKAHIMKKSFTDNGFKIVYDKDLDVDIADGFYFTFGYPGMTGVELLDELVYYGISAISLSITGSTRGEGVRACVSLVPHELLPDLEIRLKKFHEDHPIK
jgi:aspartate/methionine/tyrosine aminotransferase